ncbi:MAG: hypothetical protein ACT4QF_16100 [Sporichthyaceae bacterium]
MAAETWLRVVIYRANDPNDDDAVKYMQESTAATLTMLETQPGFRLGYWGLDPEEGTMAAVTYWNSEDAITSALGYLAKLHEERASHGITIESTQNVQLFTVPAVAMWSGDDEEEPAKKRRWRS